MPQDPTPPALPPVALQDAPEVADAVVPVGDAQPGLTDDIDPNLPAAARRALAEAAARRRARPAPDLPPELGGRNGPEPVRYGDWEKKGIAIDF